MKLLWLIAEADTLKFEFGRLQEFNERWHYLLLALACAAILAFAVWMIRRDSIELPAWKCALLAALRVAALLLALVFYLQLEKRSERTVVHNSRALVLVDTSLSMGLHDTTSSAVPATPIRLEQVVAALKEGKLLEALRDKHDVSLSRFDAELTPLGSFHKRDPNAATDGKMADGKTADGDAPPEESSKGEGSQSANPVSRATDWAATLLPQGTETRLGQTLRQLIGDERSTPIAGVILFTDGGQNAGIDTSAAIAAAREAKIPIFTVGIGADRRPANVRISDVVAPSRAYPDDSFFITGYLQSEGFGGRELAVELSSRAGADAGKLDEGKLEGVEHVTLASKGEAVPVKFEIKPGERGRRVYRLKVKAPLEDSNASDDQQEVDVEIVDRKTRVLLVASGPTREFIFLRNQLKRDKDTLVDVWLQSAQGSVSQDASQVLTAFPSTPAEMFDYDCLVAFDPDWKELDANQIDLLERWVAEKAAGMIVVAGPVEMDRWVPDTSLGRIRGLYPIEFNRRFTLSEEGRYGSTVAWPLEFSREGLDAEFLWLADSGPRSQQTWSRFPGVFGYYGVRNVKPGATVYARYSDPDAASSGQLPVYMAEQFYGSGRVFFLGSGEMWRLRAMDDAYFEQLYTKLVRHVSQGRLLLGSSRGMLLVDRDRYLLGNTVVVRTQLSNAQFDPLTLPSVPLQIVRPDSTGDTLRMAADASRPGMYVGQFTALQEGSYRLELTIPEGPAELLSRRIQVKVPDLERENPQRNDALLNELAERTGGKYYVGVEAALGARGTQPLVELLPDRTVTTHLAGVTDRDFERDWTRGLMFAIAGLLCMEWLVRRLSKLA